MKMMVESTVNGASLICICYMVLEAQLFLTHSFQKVEALCVEKTEQCGF